MLSGVMGVARILEDRGQTHFLRNWGRLYSQVHKFTLKYDTHLEKNSGIGVLFMLQVNPNIWCLVVWTKGLKKCLNVRQKLGTRNTISLSHTHTLSFTHS